MYSNAILNFQECTTILKSKTKKYGNLLKASRNLAAICHLLKVIPTYAPERHELLSTGHRPYENLISLM